MLSSCRRIIVCIVFVICTDPIYVSVSGVSSCHITPTSVSRNHSDLGSRGRKRVTYRLQTSPAKYTLQSTSDVLSVSQNNPCSNDNELCDGLTSEDNVCTRIAIGDEYIAEDCSKEAQFNRNVVTIRDSSSSPSLDYSV